MQEKTKPRISKLTLSAVIVAILAIGLSVFFYVLYATKHSDSAKQQQIVDKISKMIVLPSETPTVVTVADKDRLSNKQLASKVDNGDMLLVFASAKQLVVYRPSANKVANMLTFENSTDVPADNSPAAKKK